MPFKSYYDDKKLQKPLLTKITRQEISIEQRMNEIICDLKKTKSRTSFFDLFPVPDKEHIVVTFLAVLELMKQNEIFVEQDTNFAEIFVCSSGRRRIMEIINLERDC